jgi:hypothetical protein
MLMGLVRYLYLVGMILLVVVRMMLFLVKTVTFRQIPLILYKSPLNIPMSITLSKQTTQHDIT